MHVGACVVPWRLCAHAIMSMSESTSAAAAAAASSDGASDSAAVCTDVAAAELALAAQPSDASPATAEAAASKLRDARRIALSPAFTSWLYGERAVAVRFPPVATARPGDAAAWRTVATGGITTPAAPKACMSASVSCWAWTRSISEGSGTGTCAGTSGSSAGTSGSGAGTGAGGTGLGCCVFSLSAF